MASISNDDELIESGKSHWPYEIQLQNPLAAFASTITSVSIPVAAPVSTEVEKDMFVVTLQ